MIHNAVVGGSFKIDGNTGNGINFSGEQLKKGSFISYSPPDPKKLPQVSLGTDKAMTSYTFFTDFGDYALYCYKDSDAKYYMVIVKKITLEKGIPVMFANGVSTSYTSQMGIVKTGDNKVAIYVTGHKTQLGYTGTIVKATLDFDSMSITIDDSVNLTYPDWYPIYPGDCNLLYDSDNNNILFVSDYGSYDNPSGFYGKCVFYIIDLDTNTISLTAIGNSEPSISFIYTKDFNNIGVVTTRTVSSNTSRTFLSNVKYDGSSVSVTGAEAQILSNYIQPGDSFWVDDYTIAIFARASYNSSGDNDSQLAPVSGSANICTVFLRYDSSSGLFSFDKYISHYNEVLTFVKDNTDATGLYTSFMYLIDDSVYIAVTGYTYYIIMLKASIDYSGISNIELFFVSPKSSSSYGWFNDVHSLVVVDLQDSYFQVFNNNYVNDSRACTVNKVYKYSDSYSYGIITKNYNPGDYVEYYYP